MRRIHKISVCVTLASIAWLAALQLQMPQRTRALVLLAPLLLLVVSGMYMLLLLLCGTVTFQSYPDEAKALHQDIARAKADLLSRGYKVEHHVAY